MTTNGSKHNGSGMNGSGNGQGGNHDEENHDDSASRSVIQFPTLADRDRMRKEKQAQEEAWRAEYRAKQAASQKAAQRAANPPFLNIPNIPPFVRVIVPLLIAIQALQSFMMNDLERMQLFMRFGFVPSHIYPQTDMYSILTPFTHMFLHGGWTHLGMNLIMLVALGSFFAREFGTKETVKFYLASGFGGAALFYLVHFGQSVPLIGASGAIQGLFAVLIVMLNRRGAFGQFNLVRKYGIVAVIGFWLAFMVGISVLLGGQSWEAHVGGFVTGLLYFCYILRKDLRFWKL